MSNLVFWFDSKIECCRATLASSRHVTCLAPNTFDGLFCMGYICLRLPKNCCLGLHTAYPTSAVLSSNWSWNCIFVLSQSFPNCVCLESCSSLHSTIITVNHRHLYGYRNESLYILTLRLWSQHYTLSEKGFVLHWYGVEDVETRVRICSPTWCRTQISPWDPAALGHVVPGCLPWSEMPSHFPESWWNSRKTDWHYNLAGRHLESRDPLTDCGPQA